jgi:hypothetical protein
MPLKVEEGQPSSNDGKNVNESTRAKKSVKILNGAAFEKILVAVDGSKNAERAAKIAAKLAERNAAQLIVISVIPRPSYLFAPVSGAGVPPMGSGDYYTYATRDAEKCVNEGILS